MDRDGLIRAESLGFVYEGGEQPAFAGLSGFLNTGDLWLLRGPNGVGKTTALRVLAGLAPRVFPGHILGSGCVLGSVLDAGGTPGLAERVGVLPDNPWAQVSGLRTSVRGEISLGLENRGWRPEAIRRRTSELLGLLGLEHVADRSPRHLSGGEYQSLGVACAIAHEPEVLLLDEPELHLDRGRIDAVTGLVGSALDHGSAVVCATHLPGPALPEPRCVWEGAPPSLPEESAVVLPSPPQFIDDVASLREVTFHYPGQSRLLDRVTLQLSPGTITALTGPNGSGKTTIAKLILGLLRPLSGVVTVCGRPTHGRRASEVAEHVSIAFQDPRLQLFRRTVREEITMSLRAGSTPGAVDDIAAAFGIGEDLDLSPYDLSWSRRRLAAMACAIARAPSLLILDEPTAGLDAAERARVGRLLRRWAKLGGSVLLITHDTVWAAAASDVQISMRGLTEAGGHDAS